MTTFSCIPKTPAKYFPMHVETLTNDKIILTLVSYVQKRSLQFSYKKVLLPCED